MLNHLNDRRQAFIGRMEMMFITTADRSGEADCSFRAGPPGFVCVLDERALAYPEYRGNAVMASLGNVVETGTSGCCSSTSAVMPSGCTSTVER